MKIPFILIISFFFAFETLGQTQETDTTVTSNNHYLQCKSLIIPAALVTYGFWGSYNGYLQTINLHIRQEDNEHIDKKTTIDNFSEYVPTLSVYGLNVLGVKGKNDFKNRTLVIATSFMIMSTTVSSLKSITRIERPDGSSKNSFPSGHTATAFMGAEFLWQEYKDVSVWYGIAGYSIAAGTGALRIYNNRHWLTDVAAGAGIGMLSTKIAYWSQPFLSRKLYGASSLGNVSGLICPFIFGHQTGIALALNF